MKNGILTEWHGIILMGNNKARGWAFALLMVLISGCAAADRNVNFLYQPTSMGTGGSGDLYLAQAVISEADRQKKVQWVLGEVTNSAGEGSGRVLTGRAPVDTVMDALMLEFKAAGYNVLPVKSLPEGVAKGLRVTGVTFRLDETDRVYKVETKCSVKVSIEPWRNGAAIKRLDYESSYEDATVLDRDTILLQALQSALQQLMARAVRESILLIEQK